MIQKRDPQMSTSERLILESFRRFQAGPDEMLFLNPADCKLQPTPFKNAMQSLIRQSFVVKERPKSAYSLTRGGYNRSVSIEPAKTPVRRAKQPA